MAKRRPPDPADVEIGRRLRAAREGLHLTQLDVATALGISEATYGRREAGLIKVSVPALERTARILGLAPESLLPGAAPPAPAPVREPEVLLRELRESIAHYRAGEDDPRWVRVRRRWAQLPPELQDKLLEGFARRLDRFGRPTDPPPGP